VPGARRHLPPVSQCPVQRHRQFEPPPSFSPGPAIRLVGGSRLGGQDAERRTMDGRSPETTRANIGRRVGFYGEFRCRSVRNDAHMSSTHHWLQSGVGGHGAQADSTARLVDTTAEHDGPDATGRANVGSSGVPMNGINHIPWRSPGSPSGFQFLPTNPRPASSPYCSRFLGRVIGSNRCVRFCAEKHIERRTPGVAYTTSTTCAAC